MMSFSENIYQLSEKWIGELMRDMMQDLAQFSHQHGLTFVQTNILLWLHQKGAAEVSALCAHSHGTKAAASQMVERMVQDGLVERVESRTDRRVRLVSLTERGRSLALECVAVRQKRLYVLINRLSAPQQEQLRSILLMFLGIQEEDLKSTHTLDTGENENV